MTDTKTPRAKRRMPDTPAFRYVGGKARLRAWLLQRFPREGDAYLEPFVGLGNVFYAAHAALDFDAWWLSDIDTSFFDAVRTADLSQLPATVSKEDFARWRVDGGPIARLIEPRVTFGGKGYRYGYSGSSGTHVGYSAACYGPVCAAARAALLEPGVSVTQCSWTLAPWGLLTPRSFVYLDPPYYGTEAPYPNVDHDALIDLLNVLPCRWAISGYDVGPYATRLRYAAKHARERNAEIKGSNARTRTPVIETLWTNYEP